MLQTPTSRLDASLVETRAKGLSAHHLLVETGDGRIVELAVPAGRGDGFRRQLDELQAARVVFVGDDGRRLDELALAVAAAESVALDRHQVSGVILRELLMRYGDALDRERQSMARVYTSAMESGAKMAAGALERSASSAAGWQAAADTQARVIRSLERELAETRRQLAELRDTAHALEVALASSDEQPDELRAVAGDAVRQMLELLGHVIGGDGGESGGAA